MEIEDYIKQHFHYSNGQLTRDDRKNSNGSYDRYGYLILKVKGKQFKAHRIVWLLNYGYLPNQELDHINRNRADNRIENLRLSNRIEQGKNKVLAKNKDTGYQGILIDRTKGLKKRYSVKVSNKTHRFYTLEETKQFRIERGYNI